MMRLRLPNGIIRSSDMRYFSECVRPYGPEIGVVDITCRMNIQLRSPPLEDAADILKGLQARGMTSIMSGLDNLRNMVGSPIAGVCRFVSRRKPPPLCTVTSISSPYATLTF
jgi:ferredoxin-nitrite reductase